MRKIHKKMIDRRSRGTAIKNLYDFDFLTIREKHDEKND